MSFNLMHLAVWGLLVWPAIIAVILLSASGGLWLAAGKK